MVYVLSLKWLSSAIAVYTKTSFLQFQNRNAGKKQKQRQFHLLDRKAGSEVKHPNKSNNDDDVLVPCSQRYLICCNQEQM